MTVLYSTLLLISLSYIIPGTHSISCYSCARYVPVDNQEDVPLTAPLLRSYVVDVNTVSSLNKALNTSCTPKTTKQCPAASMSCISSTARMTLRDSEIGELKLYECGNNWLDDKFCERVSDSLKEGGIEIGCNHSPCKFEDQCNHPEFVDTKSDELIEKAESSNEELSEKAESNNEDALQDPEEADNDKHGDGKTDNGNGNETNVIYIKEVVSKKFKEDQKIEDLIKVSNDFDNDASDDNDDVTVSSNNNDTADSTDDAYNNDTDEASNDADDDVSDVFSDNSSDEVDGVSNGVTDSDSAAIKDVGVDNKTFESENNIVNSTSTSTHIKNSISTTENINNGVKVNEDRKEDDIIVKKSSSTSASQIGNWSIYIITFIFIFQIEI